MERLANKTNERAVATVSLLCLSDCLIKYSAAAGAKKVDGQGYTERSEFPCGRLTICPP
jgi:hypothetical protein